MIIIEVGWDFDPSKNETYEDWNKIWDVKWNKLNKTSGLISSFGLKICSREDFANFNATEIYDNLDTLNPINKITEARYCFDIPKNETLPEYGDS